MIKKFIILSLLVLLPVMAIGEEKTKIGSIRGRVIDTETKMPLPGVSVILLETIKGAVTDIEGEYSISNVAVGNYQLKIQLLGYETAFVADVIIRPKRITFANIELKESAIKSDDVVVTAGYFAESEDEPVSNVQFSFEEIRRAPGAAGDVSRIITALPSIAKIDNTKNTLYVRGGASFENGFYIDNIEIPNINHYPEMGASGGPIGILNVDFISNVEFLTGAFPARFGDRLSAIMDIDFREGNREEFDGQLDLNFSGAGGVLEGPLGKNGSWLLSARKSYLDMIVSLIGEDENSVPNYGDIQGKAVYDLSNKHQLTFLDIFSIDAISQDLQDAIEEKDDDYDDFNFTANTFGVNWRYLWGKSGYSNTSVSHTLYDYSYDGYETKHYIDNGTELQKYDFNSIEHEYKFRNVNFYKASHTIKFEFGLEARVNDVDYDNYYGHYYDDLGNEIPPHTMDDKLTESKYHGFISCGITPFKRLTITPGARVSYYTLNENTTVSPRLSLSYILSPLTTLSAAGGIYYQNLPLSLTAQNAANTDLDDPKAYHFVLGVSHLLTENTRLSVELYTKEYRDFPLDPMQPQLFTIDDIASKGIYLTGNPLVSGGEAYSRGIEVMVQKKLAKDIYGMISGGYSRSRYKGYDGIWYDRTYDNQFNINVEGGYKPNNRWEFSMRWSYAGGAPYTPYDIAASEALGSGVYDESRINGERYPDYHSLNLRFDRRFNFAGSNLIFYLSVWNVYNRDNIGGYEWDEFENVPEASEQWSTLPIFGLEYEF